jgi:glycosyltransferase involved in cell wall biosynthesis
MRILIYANLPEVGGGGTIVLKLAEALIGAGWTVAVLTRWQIGFGMNTAVQGALESMGVCCTRLDKDEGQLDWSSWCMIFKKVVIDQPDALLSIGVGWMAAGLAALRPGRRNLYFYINHDPLSPGFRRLRWLSVFMQGISVISSASLLPLRHLAAGETELAWLPQFSEPILPADWQDSLSGERRRCVGFVGTLSETKGVPLLLRVWRELDLEADLLIAGDGPCRTGVENEARETAARNKGRVVYAGKFSATQRDSFLADFFPRVQLLVAPTVVAGEGIQTVILEALAFGCPVLATRLGGTVCFDDPELRDSAVELCAVVELRASLLAWWQRTEHKPERARIQDYFRRHFSNGALCDRWLAFLGGQSRSVVI